MIDYQKWSQKPLEGPKQAVVVPAIESSVTERRDALIGIIKGGASASPQRDNPDLETAFGRLYSDQIRGSLGTTLERAGVAAGSLEAQFLEEALAAAQAQISLPVVVIRQTPSISAHKQQKLYETLRGTIDAKGVDGARRLIPLHPREADAFNSYAEILELCHRILLGLDTTKKLHRFHALMAKKWMQGLPVPQIIEDQIQRNSSADVRKVIRDTLDTIETQIRFQAVRLFGCYNALLSFALTEVNLHELMSSIPSVPLYLELGASDKTMISFISLGLSRVSAMKLNDLAARKEMDPAQAREWLRTRQLDQLGLSPLLQDEVRSVLGSS